MSDETLIKVDGVSKKYCRSLKKSLLYGLQDLGNEILGRRHGGDGKTRPSEFWAVKNVSFELKRSECLGLIGRNGAGKTTLLRMLNGLIKPDQGRIELRGKIGALISLGAGFNPILTGRENILINASVLGLKKTEISNKLEEIIDFSGLRDFIDMPVQSYSSGMQVRLGFAVASAMTPDILILDEILAVGDASFRSKCYNKISALKKQAAVIFVSHSMEQVARISNMTLVLNSGSSIYLGNNESAINIYEDLNKENSEEAFISLTKPIINFDATPTIANVKTGGSIQYQFKIKSEKRLNDFQIRLYFYDSFGIIAAEGQYNSNNWSLYLDAGDNVLLLKISSLSLKNGRYYISINLIDSCGALLVWCRHHHQILVTNSHVGALAHFILSDAELIKPERNEKNYG